MSIRNRVYSATVAKELLLASTALVALAMPVAAQDATWLQSPGSADFNTAANWSPASVPTGTAFFGASNATSIIVGGTTIGGWTFNPGAAAYIFQLGGGTLTFNGAGVVINGGSAKIDAASLNVVTFQNSSTAGAATIALDVGSTLTFSDSSTAGRATITNNRGSTVTFRNTSTAANAAITSNGSSGISFQNTSSAANATITNNGGSTITFQNTSSAANANIVNNAIMTFADGSSAGNANIINSGTMSFGQTSTAGNATISNTGVVQLGSATSNTARLINGSGAKVVGFNNATLGSIEGGGIIGFTALATGSTLTVGTNNLSTTFSGVLSETDPIGTLPVVYSLTKVGTGALTLSGANDYLGATTVNGGTLKVDGSIAHSMIAVNTGARLSGSGSVIDATINSGGTLAPGSGAPGSSLTINGSLALASGALYAIQINSAGQASKAIVNGSASLSGTVQLTVTPGGNYSIGQSYGILSTTGGHSGAFEGVSVTNFATSLSYADPTQVLLTLTGAKLGLLDHLNTNQQNVANVINNFFNNSSLPPNFSSLFAMSGGTLTNALTQISGEAGTTTQQTAFTAMNQFMGLMTDPFIGNRGAGTTPTAPPTAFAEDANAYVGAPLCLRTASERDACAMVARAPSAWSYDGRWSQWVAGYGGTQSTIGNATLGSNTTSSRLAGIAVGADYRFSPDTLAGFAVAGGANSFSVANGLGSGTSEMFQAGAYLRQTLGHLYATAALAYGWQDNTTDRTVTVAGLDQLRAQFNAYAWSGRIEEGYRFDTRWMAVMPYMAGQFTRFELPAYAEQATIGSNAFALNYAAKSVTATRTELGLRGENSVAMADGIFTLRERLAWAHDFNTARDLTATFQTLPGASFVVNGAAPSPNAALATLSAEQKWLNGFSLAATFEGEFSQVTRSYAGKGVLRYVW